MDGIEATRLLKAAFPDLGIVALTGLEDQEPCGRCSSRAPPATS